MREPSAVVEILVANHARFLAFLQTRLPADQAEDCLQAAYVKGLERLDDVRADEKAVPWFFRLLRNAVIDAHRRDGARARANRRASAELPDHFELELKAAICACVGDLIDTLAPSLIEPLRRVDLGEEPVKQVAADLGVTPNALRVRLHRGRKALAQRLRASCGTCTTHGCLDCTCGKGR